MTTKAVLSSDVVKGRFPHCGGACGSSGAGRGHRYFGDMIREIVTRKSLKMVRRDNEVERFSVWRVWV